MSEGGDDLKERLRAIIEGFDDDVAEELSQAEAVGERADLWTEVDVSVATLREALASIEELERALEPFAAVAEKMDANAVEFLRPQQHAEKFTDEELARLEMPDSHAILSSGDMRNPVLATMGDLRRARAAIRSRGRDVE